MKRDSRGGFRPHGPRGGFGGRGGFGSSSRGSSGGQAVIRIHGGMHGRDDVVPVENLYLQKKQALATGQSTAGIGLQPCWICGSDQHRRSDCPKRFEMGGIQTKLQCLGCRKLGHKLAECPERGQSFVVGGGTDAAASGTCFNCGAGHRLRDCPQPRNGSALPFALCFVCGNKGHLAKDCSENAGHGLYPRGGACKICGDKTHFAKDCPLEAAGQRADGTRFDGHAPRTSQSQASGAGAGAASSSAAPLPVAAAPVIAGRVKGDDDLDTNLHFAGEEAAEDDVEERPKKKSKKSNKRSKSE